jgi:O-Antigen ligase
VFGKRRSGKSGSKGDMSGASRVILPPYSDPTSGSQYLNRPAIIVYISIYCFFYGLFFAFFAPYMLMAFLIPIVVLVMLIIWALPDMPAAPSGLLVMLFYTFFTTLIVWPNYLALSLPGLPWITVTRMSAFPLVLTMLTGLSVSKDFRRQISTSLNSAPFLWISIAVFSVMQFLSIFISKNPGTSIDKFIVAQTTCTSIFFISAYLFLKPGRVERWAILAWAAAIFVGVIGVFEHLEGKVLWAGHIPSFLKIEDETVQRILAGSARSATGKYRVQGTFSTSLGLSEYLALVMPFALHLFFSRSNWILKISAGISIPFLLTVVIFTDSRLGLVGCILSFLSFTLVMAIRRWRHRKDSIMGPAISLAYPAIFVLAIASIAFIGRLRALVLGNGPQTVSNESRLEQYRLALPLIIGHPAGHGIGMAAETLGFNGMNGGGMLTIDSYYLSIALDYGWFGFILFYAIILYSMFKSGRAAFLEELNDRDQSFMIPIFISMVSFLVIKSVFSQPDNLPVMFIMIGIVVALTARARTIPVAAGHSQRATRVPETSEAWEA